MLRLAAENPAVDLIDCYNLFCIRQRCTVVYGALCVGAFNDVLRLFLSCVRPPFSDWVDNKPSIADSHAQIE